jgi:phenylacetate-CoA ligase
MDHTDQISAHIKNTIGISTQIRIVAPALGRSLGEAKRVFDKRPEQ